MRWGSLTGILLLNVLLKQVLPGSSYVKCIMLIQAYLALLRFTDVAVFFFQIEGKTLHHQKVTPSLTRFIAMVRNRTCNISEVCLYCAEAINSEWNTAMCSTTPPRPKDNITGQIFREKDFCTSWHFKKKASDSKLKPSGLSPSFDLPKVKPLNPMHSTF